MLILFFIKDSRETSIETAAFIVLRIAFAWIFVRPLPTLLKDFKGSVDLVSLALPFWQRFFTVIMLLVMFFGALSIFLVCMHKLVVFFFFVIVSLAILFIAG